MRYQHGERPVLAASPFEPSRFKGWFHRITACTATRRKRRALEAER
jgi:hypothetical protein